MDKISKQYIILGVVLLVVVGVAGYFLLGSKKVEKNNSKDTVFEEPTEIIPTVDASVKVSIKGNTEGVIMLSGIPSGTREVEYELSYNTGSGSMEGVFGTIKVSGSSKAEEKITFGTCSSGACRYHDIKGAVKGTFKFTGSYGKRLLEKNFDL